MAAMVSLDHVGVAPNHANEHPDQEQTQLSDEDRKTDLSQRAQWLRAAVLGANDGLVSVSSLMMGVGAVQSDGKGMLVAGFAGSVAGACSMAIGEFVSVYTQYEVEVGQMKRDITSGERQVDEERTLPNPFQAAFASAFSFSIGALFPLLSAASITNYKIRLLVIVAVASLALVVFGMLGAVMGKTPKIRSCVRVLFGGWLAMAITFGLTKLLGTKAL